jgi:hypothetical protein
MRTVMRSDRPREERENAREALDAAAAVQQRRTPSDRHERRMEALYVDPDASGTSWNRPRQQVSPEMARRLIEHAANDYAGEYDRVHLGNTNDDELREALNAWKDRPELPRPEWPT